MRLVFTPFRVSVERLDLSICVCRHLLCKSCNKPIICDTGFVFTTAATAYKQRRTLNLVMRTHFVCRNFPNCEGIFLSKAKPLSTSPPLQAESTVSKFTSCCLLKGDNVPVTFEGTCGRNAQHKSHCSRFFTGVTASTSSRPTYS